MPPTKSDAFTISVFTRHSADCPHRADSKFKDCSCRKSLYIYANGKVRTESAKTRSWEEAEREVERRLEKYDPLGDGQRREQRVARRVEKENQEEGQEPATPSAPTISVFTRHSKECPKYGDRTWKKCNCRKSLYIYQNGKARTETTKTRSWEKAEKEAARRRLEYDPATIAARRLDAERARLIAQEEQKKTDKEASRMLLGSALDRWFTGLKFKSDSYRDQHKIVIAKFKNWAEEKNLTCVDEVKFDLLYEWHGQWSPDAKNERDRIAPATAACYLPKVRAFFKWALAAEYIERDPSVQLKRQRFDHVQTKPLSNPQQFEELLEATRLYDKKHPEMPAYGRDLRAIFLLQRWVGLRLSDAVLFKRTGLRHTTKGPVISLTTKKTKAHIVNRPIPVEVAKALMEIPEGRDHVRPGFYFASAGCDDDNLTIVWTQRIAELNEFLALTDEDGEPMTFRSHMLRDTFAVDLLVKGVPLEEVSKLLTHKSIKMTEKYYAPWIRQRLDTLHERLVATWEEAGVSTRPQARVM